MNIREQTGLIIERNGEYLVGAAGMFLRWSTSPYDAWRTRKREKAYKVAWIVKGNILLFNPIVGQLRLLK